MQVFEIIIIMVLTLLIWDGLIHLFIQTFIEHFPLVEAPSRNF